MGGLDRYTVISADCHAGADLREYRPYLEAEYLDEFDDWADNYVSPFGDLVQARCRPQLGQHPPHARPRGRRHRRRGHLPEHRAAVLPEGWAHVARARRRPSSSRRLAGLRAHNRWLADVVRRVPRASAPASARSCSTTSTKRSPTCTGSPTTACAAACCCRACRPGSPIPPLHAPDVRPGVAGVRGAGRAHRPRTAAAAPRLRRVPRVAVDVADGDRLVLAPAAVDVHHVAASSTGSRACASCSPSRAAAGSANALQHDGRLRLPDRQRQRRRAALPRAAGAPAHAERVLAEQLRGRRELPAPRRLRAPRTVSAPTTSCGAATTRTWRGRSRSPARRSQDVRGRRRTSEVAAMLGGNAAACLRVRPRLHLRRSRRSTVRSRATSTPASTASPRARASMAFYKTVVSNV